MMFENVDSRWLVLGMGSRLTILQAKEAKIWRLDQWVSLFSTPLLRRRSCTNNYCSRARHMKYHANEILPPRIWPFIQNDGRRKQEGKRTEWSKGDDPSEASYRKGALTDPLDLVFDILGAPHSVAGSFLALLIIVKALHSVCKAYGRLLGLIVIRFWVRSILSNQKASFLAVWHDRSLDSSSSVKIKRDTPVLERRKGWRSLNSGKTADTWSCHDIFSNMTYERIDGRVQKIAAWLCRIVLTWPGRRSCLGVLQPPVVPPRHFCITLVIALLKSIFIITPHMWGLVSM